MTVRNPIEEELDELEELMLRSARHSEGLGASASSRVLAALNARIAAATVIGLPNIEIPPVPDGSVVPLPARAGAELSSLAQETALEQALPHLTASPWYALTAVKALGATVALAGSIFLGPRLLSESTPAGSPSAPPAIPRDTSAERPSFTSPPVPSSEIAPPPSLAPSAPAPAASPSPTTGPERPKLRHAAAPRSKPAKAESSISSINGLTEEIEGLHAAQTALREGSPSRALRLVEALELTGLDASLHLERRIIKVLALCALGRQAEAQAQLPTNSQSANVYANRLKNSCVDIKKLGDR